MLESSVALTAATTSAPATILVRLGMVVEGPLPVQVDRVSPIPPVINRYRRGSPMPRAQCWFE
jgi:hypothetical protein